MELARSVEGDLCEPVGEESGGFDIRGEPGLVIGAVLDAEVDVGQAIGFRHSACRRYLPRITQVDHRSHAERQEAVPVLATELGKGVRPVQPAPPNSAAVAGRVAAQISEVV